MNSRFACGLFSLATLLAACTAPPLPPPTPSPSAGRPVATRSHMECHATISPQGDRALRLSGGITSVITLSEGPPDAPALAPAAKPSPPPTAHQPALAYQGAVFDVAAPPALQGAALPFLAHFDRALAAEFGRLGVATTTETKPLLLVFTVRDWPKAYQFKTPWEPGDPGHIRIPFPVLAAPGLPWTNTCDGLTFPDSWVHFITHEVTEWRLTTQTPGTLLGDDPAGSSPWWLGGQPAANHDTRWFREGLSEFVSLSVEQALGLPGGAPDGEPQRALDRIGAGLLRWRQDEHNEAAYYHAACGLVERIIAQNPPGAMQAVMAELRRYETVDGAGLNAALTRITGRSAREYCM